MHRSSLIELRCEGTTYIFYAKEKKEKGTCLFFYGVVICFLGRGLQNSRGPLVFREVFLFKLTDEIGKFRGYFFEEICDSLSVFFIIIYSYFLLYES